MSKRTISINPQFFNISKKKKKIIPSEVNINASNIRQLLLDKLREHKKTRKIETSIGTGAVTKNTPLQNKTFDENCKEEIKEKQNEKNQNNFSQIKNVHEVEKNQEKEENEEKKEDQMSQPSQTNDKPYGNLKNGSKPTYKQMYDAPQNMRENDPIILEEKEVKKTFKLGKSGKTISILIKNNKTRKKVEDSKTEFKKKNLGTIKNYLKEKNLIKFGSSAPSKLLREMYETSEICGGILNQNKDILIHNFDK